MKKISKRILSFVIALLGVVALTGCVIQEGTKIEFTKLPAGVYTSETGSINLSAVEIKVDGTVMNLETAIQRPDITVSGNTWNGYGNYTLVVLWNNTAISFNYSVIQDFVEESYDINWNGTGTEQDPYQLENELQLKGLAAVVNGKLEKAGLDPHCKGVYFKLMNNVELTAGWEPIGAGYRDENLSGHYFAGNFDGGNHVISNLTNVGYNPIEAAGTYASSSGEKINYGYVFGLFGMIFGSTIENVRIDNVYTEDITLVIDNKVTKFTLDSVGAIAGYICLPREGDAVTGSAANNITTYIKNCHVLSGEINGYDATAGIVGRSYYSASFVNCSNAANISCDRLSAGKCGGITSIAGSTTKIKDENGENLLASHEIYNCSNSGNISSQTTLVGGIVGLINCEGTFKESGNTNTGKLFAINNQIDSKYLGKYQDTGERYFEDISKWLK